MIYAVRDSVPILLKSDESPTYEIAYHHFGSRERMAGAKRVLGRVGWLRKPIDRLFRNAFYNDTSRRIRALLSPGCSVLVVGCRELPYFQTIGTDSYHLLVVDLDLESVLHVVGLRLANVNGVVTNVEYLALQPSSFDLIICTEVIEHINDDTAAIARMSEALKPDGTLFITTPNYLACKDIPPEHIRHYEPDQLRQRLAENFANVDVTSRFRMMKFLIAEFRLKQAYFRNRNPVILVLSLLVAAAYNLIMPIERLFGRSERGYNLVAYAASPRSSTELKPEPE